MRLRAANLTSILLVVMWGASGAQAAPGGQGGSDHGQASQTSSPRSDQDRARDAVAKGRAEPLDRILSQLERRLGGRVIDVRIITKGKRTLYDLTVLGDDGRTRHVIVDARTGVPE